ncbi:copper chaperone PCu(A)C [Sulfitobacter sp. M57]|uniref:copper chaperone PCu(A)C n=1 Tax=unclassified Sulfitobacter TaxID=196795 RepID=UPI0023E1C403|nr:MULTISPECIES: copper chaperone PCu(A)C [unclassified Sulfitobacter]MDF3415779.1 copper chaperone PCu(A)C [Sulfitobacter sp. KE5]MDF3423259.1 copper chaperone PCu(A)C [Sulfitobacter sp. KE43]MDF3434325.1 copper chaperone PCu(A)C [Sulfitobacter sp. KE42]MDF3459642.1 copper chaperone PCu(A)C [Sulfitobacter sp. S74]MDF3463863.1 copper chaperone PCu(A)C [Sulfitobacter sp. Ks18]
MKFTTVFAAGIAASILSATALFAGDISIKDAYARSSTPTSKTGAAFLMLMNAGDADDRLVAASSDVAKRVELHTHKDAGNGVMQMVEIEGGITVPAGGMHMLQRGGDHIMFMGLTGPLEQGQEVNVTLTFEKAGEVEVVIPVDHERKADHGAMKHDHSN